MEELQNLIKDMDVPELRRTDLRWLLRNLFIRNSQHQNFNQAVKVIKQLLREQ